MPNTSAGKVLKSGLKYADIAKINQSLILTTIPMNTDFSRIIILFRRRDNILYCRITVNKVRCNSDFSVNEKINPDKWDSKRQLIIGNGPEAQIQNARLERIRAQIREYALDLSNKGLYFNANSLKRLYTGKDKLRYTLIETSLKHIAYLQQLPRDEVATGTIKGYKSRHANMVNYLTCRKLTQLGCEEFAPSLARDFLLWMKTEKDPPSKHNHASKNLDLIRTVIKFSINQEWTKYNPLQAFINKKAKNQMPPYLSEEERDRLQNKTFSIERLQQIKDVFVFCCHTGLSFADVKIFRGSRHLVNDNNRVWIEMKRIKTGIDFYVPLTGIALQILQYYGGEQLPVPSNGKFNAYLKEIQELCGITTTLTVRVARTTFGVVMLNDMNVPLETVSKMLGHASVKITEKHYTHVLRRKIVRDLVVGNPLLYQTVNTVRPAVMKGLQLVRSAATIELE
jgi:site-specific recombinase XerD